MSRLREPDPAETPAPPRKIKMNRALAVLLISCGLCAYAEENQPAERVTIPMIQKERDFVAPETVGVGKDCPFPTVRKRIVFLCPCCGMKMSTHVLYPTLPHCPKDGSPMFEQEDKPKKKKDQMG